MTSAALNTLPTELLEAILLLLDEHDLLSVSLVCGQIYRHITESALIWRSLCISRFGYWDDRHSIATKLTRPIADVDWRSLFIERIDIERQTRSFLGTTLSTQSHRNQPIDAVARFGYDAKETLLRETVCPDDAEDVLARRFYATVMLQRIHRETSIKLWTRLSNNHPISLEHGLAAYDVFVRSGEDVSIEMVVDELDRLAATLLAERPDFRDLSTREQATWLITALRAHGFRGVPDASYRALQNSFLSLILQSATHESLPLATVAIFCAVARRLGLDARPCGFVYHVYALVYAPQNHNLDGAYKPRSSNTLDHMYVDPFRSAEEVRQEDLVSALRTSGHQIPPSQQARFLGDATVQDLVIRTAKNIISSVQTLQDTDVTGRLDIKPDMDTAFYTAIWALLILSSHEDQAVGQGRQTLRSQILPLLLEHFQTHSPWDLGMVQDYVVPMFQGQREGTEFGHYLQRIHQKTFGPKLPHRRDASTRNVQYRVGQLFRHKRYGYEGVITGWDASCGAGEGWIQEMRIDDLPHGRSQAFYHIL